MLNDKCYIERCKDIECVDIDGEVAMMNIKFGKYYVLNEVASDIWNFIDSEKNIDEIIQYLTSIYNVDYDVCKNESVSCLEILEENNLIEVK
ncbi:MAG: PqqD family peptide modification chaperone [Sarcina sp.]